MRILLTGASGFVGGALLRAYPGLIPSPSLRGLSEDGVRRIVEESGADAVIHTAAISDISVCEKRPEDSFQANVLLPEYLARACGPRKLICFSSDQVYGGSDGPGPYSEGMEKPANVYAVHKLEMENRVLALSPDAVLLRAEWMYDWPGTRPNFLLNILRAEGSVAFSSRQYRGVTWLREVAEVLPVVLNLPGGVYNFGCETDLSMMEITREFVRFLGRPLIVEDAPSRHSLWMDCSKAAERAVRFSSALDGLKRCAAENRLISLPEEP